MSNVTTLDQDRYETILIDKRENGVTIASLNRPDRQNRVNARLHTELSGLGVDLDNDRETRVLVLTGMGESFCAGGDPSGHPDGKVGFIGDMLLEASRVVDNILNARKPIVAAVNGDCLGFGATIALLSDVVVASRSAVFADTHVLIGAGAGDGGQIIWPLLMGVNRAKYYLMTGESMNADEAERLGLVNFVVDGGDALPRAIEIANRLAALPIQAVMASKYPINQAIRARSAQILPLSLAMEDASLHSKEFKEWRSRGLAEA
jgi:enoyl-CoA hydratase